MGGCLQDGDRVFVAGAETLVGAALCRALRARDGVTLVGDGASAPDTRDPQAMREFLVEHRPDYVFVLAGKSGGIERNRSHPAELMLDNLRVAMAVLPAAADVGVGKLLYLGSSCVYPRLAPQPLSVDSLMTGPLEPTNAAYALSKLAGMQLCDALGSERGAPFVTAIATNYYGPGDHFDPENSHVIAALIRRLHEAKCNGAPEVVIWGSGKPRREFMYVDDVAAACLFAMEHHDGPGPLNLGGGCSVSIAELAAQLREIVGYRGALRFDTDRPDGMPEKSLDATRLQALGFAPRTGLAAGLGRTYQWFLEHVA